MAAEKGGGEDRAARRRDAAAKVIGAGRGLFFSFLDLFVRARASAVA